MKPLAALLLSVLSGSTISQQTLASEPQKDGQAARRIEGTKMNLGFREDGSLAIKGPSTFTVVHAIGGAWRTNTLVVEGGQGLQADLLNRSFVVGASPKSLEMGASDLTPSVKYIREFQKVENILNRTLSFDSAEVTIVPQDGGFWQALDEGSKVLLLEFPSLLPQHIELTMRRRGSDSSPSKVTLRFGSSQSTGDASGSVCLYYGKGSAYAHYPTGLQNALPKPLVDAIVRLIRNTASAIRGASVQLYPRFTVHPTTDARFGLVEGDLLYFVTSSEDGLPTLYSCNYIPGARVYFGDKAYRFPVADGLVAQGEGVQFVVPDSSAPDGVEQIGKTQLTRVEKPASAP